MGQTKTAFVPEALVDFVDDALIAGRTLTPADLDAMMAALAGLGIRRVSWGYYADGRGGMLSPTGYTEDYQGGWKHCDATYRTLGNPLAVAVAAGHRHGLEVYAYFKPYETGPALLFPEGSPPAQQWGLLEHLGGRLGWLDPFVRQHPELRIKRRTDDLPANVATAPICALRLTKKDAAPTRLTREHLQLWTSPNNYRYQPRPVDFTLTETVTPAPREVRDHCGNVLTRQGDPVRVLTLSGLNLSDRYLLVTTDYAEGAADFVNSGLALITALDEQGREIPGVVASGGAVWAANLVDFRRGGLVFDYGWGAAPVTLDAPNASGKQGFIAFTRGRNAYLPGPLCETEPRVQEFWLACLDEMIAAGVDGVDFREENHGTHTDYPADYGFNQVVLDRCAGRDGDLLANVAAVRGDAYTAFLRQCKQRLAAAGRRLRYNLQVDFFRPDPPAARLLAYPANIQFNWRQWLAEGLLDSAILRFFHLQFNTVMADPIAREMVSRCNERHVPITVNRYIGQAGDALPDEVRRTREDGRFNGFIFYETYDYLKFAPTPGQCSISRPLVTQAAAIAKG